MGYQNVPLKVKAFCSRFFPKWNWCISMQGNGSFNEMAFSEGDVCHRKSSNRLFSMKVIHGPANTTCGCTQSDVHHECLKDVLVLYCPIIHLEFTPQLDSSLSISEGSLISQTKAENDPLAGSFPGQNCIGRAKTFHPVEGWKAGIKTFKLFSHWVQVTSNSLCLWDLSLQM